jgi:hypothetical protein
MKELIKTNIVPDDSGTHSNSSWCVMAGYFGSERHWNRFDYNWRKVLDAEGLEEFHANRFWAAVSGSNVPEYRGWDKERANKFIARFLKVIQGAQRIFPFSCAVLMEEWQKLSQDERAYLTGGAQDQEGKIVTPGAPNKPYFLPFLTVISTALDYCNAGHVMHFSFDQSRDFSGYARQYFNEIRTWNLPKYERMGDISFVDSEKSTPVQAADLLAFETYRYGLARLKVNLRAVNPRLVLNTAVGNIRNPRNDAKMFDRRGFDLVLEHFRYRRDSKSGELDSRQNLLSC